MQLKDIGEFGLISRFSKKFLDLIPNGFVGIGDDCAVIPSQKDKNFLVSTDMLVENVHFIKSEISAFELGHKSLAVNLSDLAASGAEPCGSFLSISLPQNIDIQWVDDFFDGYASLSKKYNCPLLGGDTTKTLNAIAINVTVVGRASVEKIKLRNKAKDGDIVCVTGYLGDSAGGLEILLDGLEKTPLAKELIKRHHNPQPRVEQGIFLASRREVNAMMDISDGINSDLKHILSLSGKSADLHLEKLPVSELLKEYYKGDLQKIYNLACGGGEDYELLLTVDFRYFTDLSVQFEKKFGNPLYAIGKINGDGGQLRWFENGFCLNSISGGYNHFSA